MMLGQAAIEYVTTYGWMVLAIALVGGTFYSQLPAPCNFEAEGLGNNDLAVQEIGITQNEELAISLRSLATEEVKVDQVQLEGNETVYSNGSITLYNSVEPVSLGRAERTEECRDFDLTIIYDKGVVPNIQHSVDLRLPIQLDKITFPFLTVGGGQVNSLDSSSSFVATGEDICLGGGCPTSGPDDNREREYVNRSGDTMEGTLRTSKIEWECIGQTCNITEGSLEGYVSDENNTVDGTLQLKEVKPSTNLCMGRTC